MSAIASLKFDLKLLFLSGSGVAGSVWTAAKCLSTTIDWIQNIFNCFLQTSPPNFHCLLVLIDQKKSHDIDALSDTCKMAVTIPEFQLFTQNMTSKQNSSFNKSSEQKMCECDEIATSKTR